MAIIKRKVSELPSATTTEGLLVLGVDAITNESVKADMELLRGNTAYQEWLKTNPGATYEQWIAMLKQPASDAATALRETSFRFQDGKLYLNTSL